jgi:putative endonuclease
MACKRSPVRLRYSPQALNRLRAIFGVFGIPMSYSVYIIYSLKLDRYYVGYSENPQERLLQHNGGISDYTAKANDWQLKYTELFNSRKEAMDRESSIKKKKSRKYIEWLISSVG